MTNQHIDQVGDAVAVRFSDVYVAYLLGEQNLINQAVRSAVIRLLFGKQLLGQHAGVQRFFFRLPRLDANQFSWICKVVPHNLLRIGDPLNLPAKFTSMFPHMKVACPALIQEYAIQESSNLILVNTGCMVNISQFRMPDTAQALVDLLRLFGRSNQRVKLFWTPTTNTKSTISFKQLAMLAQWDILSRNLHIHVSMSSAQEHLFNALTTQEFDLLHRRCHLTYSLEVDTTQPICPGFSEFILSRQCAVRKVQEIGLNLCRDSLSQKTVFQFVETFAANRDIRLVINYMHPNMPSARNNLRVWVGAAGSDVNTHFWDQLGKFKQIFLLVQGGNDHESARSNSYLHQYALPRIHASVVELTIGSVGGQKS